MCILNDAKKIFLPSKHHIDCIYIFLSLTFAFAGLQNAGQKCCLVTPIQMIDDLRWSLFHLVYLTLEVPSVLASQDSGFQGCVVFLIVESTMMKSSPYMVQGTSSHIVYFHGSSSRHLSSELW